VSTIRRQDRAERKRKLEQRRQRVLRRLKHRQGDIRDDPMLSARNIHYELADRAQGLGSGGIGAIHLLSRRSGLIEAINRRLHVLKIHQPYHESDHVLNIVYNVLCGGTCLEDLELRRHDESYLDALGADRVPDPTTAGDFCRRFDEPAIQALMNAVNQVRVEVWRGQPSSFFDEAIIDADGTLIPTTGECKEGMDYSYKGAWGYHPLLVSLANTGEPLFLMNRPGNRPSHEGAAWYLDRSARLCRQAGFRRILLRGDTDFTQTRRLDGWDQAGYRFIFGIDARSNLVDLAEKLPKTAWKRLNRPARYDVKTGPRSRPENAKEHIVRAREFKNICLDSEEVASFDYRPTFCRKAYRVVVVRKNLSIEKGEQMLFDDVRYFFYLTNDQKMSASDVVFSANDRCNQENLIAQLKAIRSLHAPVDNLQSNWAYMVMTSLAWTLKAWFALSLPETGRWSEKHKAEKRRVLRMEFKTFLNAFVRVPCQIVRTGGRIVYRLLAWNPWQAVFLRAVDVLRSPPRMAVAAHCPMRC
jgi:hypothetical protein